VDSSGTGVAAIAASMVDFEQALVLSPQCARAQHPGLRPHGLPGVRLWGVTRQRRRPGRAHVSGAAPSRPGLPRCPAPPSRRTPLAANGCPPRRPRPGRRTRSR